MDKFDRIIGYESFKKDLRCIADMLKHTSKYKKYCVDLPKAILIYGKPGLGKTLAAESLLYESKRNSYIIRKDKPDEKFIEYITATFEEAIKNQPSIVLLDDLDKFAESDEDRYNDEEFIVIQSILDNLQDQDVFVVATANDIDVLPYSLKRAGRLGRHMHFDMPNNADALAIINYYLSNTSYKLDVPADLIARIMRNRSCAELKNVISEASLSAGFAKRQYITKEDIKEALLHGVLGTRETYGEATSESKLRTAYHEAGHAIVALALGGEVDMISNVVSGNIGGFTLKGDGWREENLICNYSYKDYATNCIIDLGGKAATELIFKDIDLGTFSDLKDLKNNMDLAIGALGVNGFKYMRATGRNDFGRGKRIDDEVVRQIHRFYNKATKILKNNRKLLEIIKDKLIEQPILLYDDIVDILKDCPVKMYEI